MERKSLLEDFYDQLSLDEAEQQLEISVERQKWYTDRIRLFKAYIEKRKKLELKEMKINSLKMAKKANSLKMPKKANSAKMPKKANSAKMPK
jgi:hypothetical protein